MWNKEKELGHCQRTQKETMPFGSPERINGRRNLHAHLTPPPHSVFLSRNLESETHPGPDLISVPPRKFSIVPSAWSCHAPGPNPNPILGSEGSNSKSLDPKTLEQHQRTQPATKKETVVFGTMERIPSRRNVEIPLRPPQHSAAPWTTMQSLTLILKQAIKSSL